MVVVQRFKMTVAIKDIEVITDWLKANKHQITHFRPRKGGGVWSFLAYSRHLKIPYLMDQPYMPDVPEVANLIKTICGPEKIEDPFC